MMGICRPGPPVGSGYELAVGGSDGRMQLAAGVGEAIAVTL